MDRAIHIFDNGVRVYEDQLLEEQRLRYQRRNVHEAEEEEIFLELIRRLPPTGRFVDIGSAIGYYLILARKLAPNLTIHGFEPLERHRRFLAENLALNGLRPDSLTVHLEGLTSSEGTETLIDRGYSSRLAPIEKLKSSSASQHWRSFLEKIGLRRRKQNLVRIPTITLDVIVRRIGPIDLLQMDVQGLELEVLKGGKECLKRGEIRTFLIGTHGRAHGLGLHEQCRELLRANGYRIEIDIPNPQEQPDGILVANR
jgi:FkbM family methyltransferase